MSRTAPQSNLLKVATSSVRGFLGLVSRGQLHLNRERLGRMYAIDQRGTYQIFRETRSDVVENDDSVVLVVGFRLKVLRSFALPHWIFQRLCLLTTPFWSGLPGFRIKLWMVDPATRDYLGIYDWSGKANAQNYVEALVRVLSPLSTKGSVWYRIDDDEPFERFLEMRERDTRNTSNTRDTRTSPAS